MDNKTKILIIILLATGTYLLILSSLLEQNGGTDSVSNSPSISTSPDKEKLKLIASIAQEYSRTHVYIPGDVFDCDNMAQDVWDMLKAKGINSKIMVGNVDNSSATSLKDADHAWVMAELDYGNVAIETTGGFLVFKEDNENYYRGFSFNDPKSFRDFLHLYTDYKRQVGEYNVQVDYYNRLIEIYNQANVFDRMRMDSGIHVARLNMDETGKRMNETWGRIGAILNDG